MNEQVKTSEQENESIKTLQKFMFVLKQFPNNVALRKIGQKRMMDSLDITPEELRQIEESEENTPETNTIEQNQGKVQQQPQGNPEDDQILKELEQSLNNI